MSKYTTGELAKLCGVTVRTVQYYDTRGILAPSEITEGGRRLYNDDDLRRMKIICFLRDLGLSIDSISKLLAEDNPENIVSILIEQQAQELTEEINAGQEKLNKLTELKRELRGIQNFSLDSLGDIANIMENKKKLKKIHSTMILTGVPFGLMEIASIYMWIRYDIWWFFAIYCVIVIPYGILISRYYFKNVAYICPQCHTVFKPRFKEAFWAKHTPKTRKLTCPSCSHKGYCVETYAEKAD